PDHGVEIALAGGLREVATELVEHGRARGLTLGRAAGRDRLLALVARDELDDLLAHAVEVRTELAEHRRSHALALTDEAEEDVLGADVVVAALESLAQRVFEHLLGARGEGHVARRRLLALADDLLHL